MVLVGSKWAAWNFRALHLSIIQVFQHPVIVDRWIIISLQQNNWNDSGLTNLERTEETWGFQQEIHCQHLCALGVRKWKVLLFILLRRFPDWPNMH